MKNDNRNKIESKENTMVKKNIVYDYNDFSYKEKASEYKSYNESVPKEFYKLAFENVYWEIRQDRELAKKIAEIRNNYEERIFELQTRESEAFNGIVDFSKRRLLKEIVILIEKMLNKQKISYQKEDFSSFYRLENNQKVLYYFTWSLYEDVFVSIEEKEKRYGLSSVNKFDKIKVVAIVETGVRQDYTLGILLENDDRNDEGNYNIKIERGTLRAFFNQYFAKTEYDNFYRELKEFNKRVNDMIGYATVTLPSSGERLEEFKNRCKNELKEYDYKKILGNRNINVKQRDLIIRNYVENENFLYILGSNNFSESFLSSEWYYKQNFSKGLIEKTAIVVGYLKSIEQLLYQISLLSLDKGLKIMAKNGGFANFSTENMNKDVFNTTLFSLTNCLKHNRKVWKVNEDIKEFILNELDNFREKYRNDHFHKDNVRNIGTIEEIRNKTLELYCLLLGSLNLNGNKFDKYGELKENNSIDVEATKKRFEEWLDMLIIGNSDKQLGETLQFWICGNKIELYIYPDNIDEKSVDTAKTIITSLGRGFVCGPNGFDKDLIIDFNIIWKWIKEYLNTGKGKDILNNYKTIFLESPKWGKKIIK